MQRFKALSGHHSSSLHCQQWDHERGRCCLFSTMPVPFRLRPFNLCRRYTPRRLTSDDLLAMAQTVLGPDEWANLQSAPMQLWLRDSASGGIAAGSHSRCTCAGCRPTFSNGGVVIPTEFDDGIAALQQTPSPNSRPRLKCD